MVQTITVADAEVLAQQLAVVTARLERQSIVLDDLRARVAVLEAQRETRSRTT